MTDAHMEAGVDLRDVDIRVIDQRIGQGVGGLNTVIRAYHKPTGLLVEVPQLSLRSQYYDRKIAIEMIGFALLEAGWTKDDTP
jgi:protein subunit release factor A